MAGRPVLLLLLALTLGACSTSKAEQPSAKLVAAMEKLRAAIDTALQNPPEEEP